LHPVFSTVFFVKVFRRTLDEPFRFDVGVGQIRLYIMHEGTVHYVSLKLVDSRTNVLDLPYSGVVLARFEKSERPQHRKNPALCVRVLEIVEPIKCRLEGYDHHVPIPKVGELLMSGRMPLTKRINATILPLLESRGSRQQKSTANRSKVAPHV
jgi:hypothetical protein